MSNPANTPSEGSLTSVGPFRLNTVAQGDCQELLRQLPDQSVDVVVTSPPYWGQRVSLGMGTEDDPRAYLGRLVEIFKELRRTLKSSGILWINLGDAYNTPVNWRLEDRRFSSLGPQRAGLAPNNSAYVKPRAKRRAFTDANAAWLAYGNLLALPERLAISLCDIGYLLRGVVIWRKRNPMPEGRCRRPHRHHEPIYVFARDERHQFRTHPPVPSVWEFPNEKIEGPAHYSRFPEELPKRCIEAYGRSGPEIVVMDPFSGSGTTGVAALRLGCSYLGFEIDRGQVEASNRRLSGVSFEPRLGLTVP